MEGRDYFYEIVNSFQAIHKASDKLYGPCQIESRSLLRAMKMFLRIFEALKVPFFSSFVYRDVSGNIHKFEQVILQEEREQEEEGGGGNGGNEKNKIELGNIIMKEINKGISENGESATIAILWIKRSMEFVKEIIKKLLMDETMELKDAAKYAYRYTLKCCHGLITRNIFETGLLLSPTRDCFYQNLVGGHYIERNQIESDLKDFLNALNPVLNEIVAFYQKTKLEKYILPT